jgi:hypothetical protein
LNIRAVPWYRWLATNLSLQRPGFIPRSVRVEFVMDKLALGQIFLQVLQVSLSASFHHGSIIIWGINNRPVGGCSSEI